MYSLFLYFCGGLQNVYFLRNKFSPLFKSCESEAVKSNQKENVDGMEQRYRFVLVYLVYLVYFSCGK